MIFNKKNKFCINILFLIYLVVISLVIATYIYLSLKVPTATIIFSARSDSCQTIELFTNKKPFISLNASDHYSVSLVPDNKYATYTINVPLPLKYLRIDPCDKQKNTEFSEIAITNDSKEQYFNIAPNSYLCHGCFITFNKNSIFIEAYTNDPIMEISSVYDQISSLNIEATNIYEFTHIVLPTLFIFILLSPFLYILIKNYPIKSFLLLISLALFSLIFIKLSGQEYLKYTFSNFKNTFPIPEINNEHIIGYAQYMGYPLYFETTLFIIYLLFITIIILILYLIFKKSYKK